MTRQLPNDDVLNSDRRRRRYRCIQWIHRWLTGNGQLERRALMALVAALAVQGGTPVTAGAESSGIVDVPVAFSVQNTNTSRDPCPSDGKQYVVRGHLTGPRAAIEGPAPRAVTLYYEGFDTGEWMWRFRLAPG